jgi:hypothetical protein
MGRSRQHSRTERPRRCGVHASAASRAARGRTWRGVSVRNITISSATVVRCRRFQKLTTEQRYWSKVTKGPDHWLWTGSKSADGYGRFSADGKSVLAHRFAYQLVIGKIPAGMGLGCTGPKHPKHCVRPDHWEPVTASSTDSMV